MAGHIGGLGYSVRHDRNGNPLVGWTLTVFDSGTSTPSTVYQDYSLSIEHTNPVVADANGMMPMFWVADGTYRVRGLDPDGNELFDDDGVVALGPSSGTGGGGGGASVDENALLVTGDFFWRPANATRAGAVRANGRTIGAAASGGTERAAADAEDLFLHLWTVYANSVCAVTGGRGLSAAADWAANKTIATVDMRSKGPFGLDDMGNSAAGVTGGTTIAAARIGASTYTIAQANLPNVSLSSTALTASATFDLGLTSNTISNGTAVVRGVTLDYSSTSTSVDGAGGTNVVQSATANLTSTSATLSVSSSAVRGTITVNPAGTVPLGGSGTDLDILPPLRAGTWYIKL